MSYCSNLVLKFKNKTRKSFGEILVDAIFDFLTFYLVLAYICNVLLILFGSYERTSNFLVSVFTDPYVEELIFVGGSIFMFGFFAYHLVDIIFLGYFKRPVRKWSLWAKFKEFVLLITPLALFSLFVFF